MAADRPVDALLDPGTLLAPGSPLAAHAGPAVLTLRLPPLDPLSLWELRPAEEAVFWRGLDGRRAAGIGAATSVPADLAPVTADPTAPHPLDRALRDLDAALLRLDADARGLRPDAGPAPRLYGGAPFEAAADASGWEALGEGRFTLPAWTLEDAGRGPGSPDREPTSLLHVAFPASGPRQERADRLKETARLVGELHAAGTGILPRVVGRTDLAPERWALMVEATRDAVLSGRLEKVVLARRSEVRFSGPVDPAAVLRRLVRRAGEYVFALRRGGVTFLGASPERLLHRRGRCVRLEALAGTARLDEGPDREQALARAAERLFGSGKDLEEHALVVRGVVEALAPFVERRILPQWPRVRGLPGLAHLSSEIEVEAREEIGVGPLLSALHPTPAVGGLPRRPALAWIAETEPVRRGWFAGPIGWVEPSGDAELAVAIRSALLRGDTAWLFAGAGIVGGSDPAAEYEETERKLRRLLEALGVEAEHP